jgi:hypothetical protein
MTVKLTTLPELNRKAFAILSRELGVPDTLRFFGQLGLGTGNYTEERRELFEGLTLEDYRKGIAEAKADTEGAPQAP